MKRDLEIIHQVQEIRARNNQCWMDVVRLALAVAPRKARALLAQISANDAEVTLLMQQLGKGGKK